MHLKKRWYCLDCGHEFETPWIPSQFVRCPYCGSNRVHRIDENRGHGAGPRWHRGICRRWRWGWRGNPNSIETTQQT